MKKNINVCDVNCFMQEDDAFKHQMDIQKIKEKFNVELKDHPNYAGFDLCDVSAGGIQIRMFNNGIIKGYSYGNQKTILYDWSNLDEAINDSIQDFILCDNEKDIKFFNNFIMDGLKYGWD